MKEDELKQRTKQFGLRILKLVSALPGTTEGRGAACRGRSKAEFISKLGTVEEEADESAFWMELIVDGGLLPSRQVDALRHEAMELTAIMAASRLTATGRR